MYRAWINDHFAARIFIPEATSYFSYCDIATFHTQSANWALFLKFNNENTADGEILLGGA